MFPSTSRRSPDGVAAALDLVERAESASNVLPTPGERATFEVRGRRLRRVAANGDLVARAGPSPADGEKLRGREGAAVPLHLERRLAADEVRLAKLVGGAARVRAFYPALGATAAIHARTLRRPSRLRAAATVLARFGAIEDHVAVPPLLEHGSSRRQVDWLVEGLVDGVHPRPGERADVVRTLLPGLIRAGAHFGWERRPVSTGADEHLGRGDRRALGRSADPAVVRDGGRAARPRTAAARAAH
ncbi:MAG TPA: hypothetical protein VFD41_14355 [Actinomycetales bacterium]|nr:hypothetical protein [Actinomycetales bacterium]